MKALRFLNALLLLALFVQVAAAQDFMFVQGNLGDGSGNPLNGDFSLDFAIYRFDTGGTPLRRETQQLTIVEGFFNTMINVRSLPFDTSYWLGLSVNGGDELRPRLPLGSSPYSFTTRNLFGASNTVPSSGNVGFGTLDPQAPLHVLGGAIFEGVPVLPLPADTLPPFLVLGPGGVLQQAPLGSFPGGSFNGILQGIPLIVKDAAGNEVFRVDPDGRSFHKGEEQFAGGITLVDGVLTFPDGTRQETAAGGGNGGFNGMLNNTPLIVKDAAGDDVIRLEPDGDADFEGALKALEGILSEGDVDVEGQLKLIVDELFVGGLVPLPTSDPEDVEAEGAWRFEEALRALQGLQSEGDVKIKDASLEMLLGQQLVSQILILPTPGDERVGVDGTWDFQEELRALQAAIERLNAEQVDAEQINAENLEATKALFDEAEFQRLVAESARLLQEFVAEDGVNITGGVLTFPDGSTQSSAGGFNGMLQGVPLIVKDAAGNEVFRVNTDGTSVHEGLERFNGGLVVPVPGVGEIQISEFGVIIPLANGGGLSLDEDGISMVDGGGNEVFRVDDDGPSQFNDNVEVNGDVDIPFGGNIFVRGGTIDAAGATGVIVAEGTQAGSVAVNGKTNQPNSIGVLGEASDPSSKAGQFNGEVQVNGGITVTGIVQADVIQGNTKNFKIDHPLDPSGQYLVHTSVESPDMLTVYNGNVTLDADGAATVVMPMYFEALNGDYRYQLTPIGAPGPTLYVAEEMAGNRFKIAGGTPGLKVSWQVTGVRHDPYAKAYRSPVEVQKPAHEQGTYLHPELYGAAQQQPIRHTPGADGQ